MRNFDVRPNQRKRTPGLCPFCQRTLSLTFHHLIPKKMHRRPRFKKRYCREQLHQGILICQDCHRGIHKTYSELELATHYHTPELLLESPPLIRHFAWVAKQKSAPRGQLD